MKILSVSAVCLLLVASYLFLPAQITNPAGATISGLTTNALPKASSATAIADSAVSDNGTNVTLTSRNLLFSADASFDIGASGATRPRNIYASTAVIGPYFQGLSGTFLREISNGIWELENAAETGFTRLAIGPDTSSFPALCHSGTTLNFMLAGACTTYSPIVAGGITTTASFGANSGSKIEGSSTSVIGWSASADATAVADTAVSRCTGVPGCVAVGTGAANSVAGVIQSAAFIAGGAAPSISGCATISAQHGGNSIGDFTTSTTGACTATLTFAYTAGTGWFCDAQDLTSFASFANIFHQTGGTTTTAIIAATTVAGDVVKFACFPY